MSLVLLMCVRNLVLMVLHASCNIVSSRILTCVVEVSRPPLGSVKSRASWPAWLYRDAHRYGVQSAPVAHCLSSSKFM